MTEKEKRFLGHAADGFNACLTLVYAGVAYLLVCTVLDCTVPLMVMTVKAAHDFWIFGISAFAFGASAFALLKGAREPEARRVHRRVFCAIGIVLEAFVFIGAIAIWVEAGQYSAWVGRFQEITAASGVDVRYWVAAVLFANGIAGNLLAALLTA